MRFVLCRLFLRFRTCFLITRCSFVGAQPRSCSKRLPSDWQVPGSTPKITNGSRRCTGPWRPAVRCVHASRGNTFAPPSSPRSTCDPLVGVALSPPPAGRRPGVAETLCRREFQGQVLADSAAHRRGQQGCALRRGPHPAAQQRECVGTGGPHGAAPRSLQRPSGGTKDEF